MAHTQMHFVNIFRVIADKLGHTDGRADRQPNKLTDGRSQRQYVFGPGSRVKKRHSYAFIMCIKFQFIP